MTSNIKIIFLGDSGVGKSRICHKYATNNGYFNDSSTIGVDFRFLSYKTGGKTYKVHIWDTAGQEKYKSIVSTYFREIHSSIIVFDITNYSSFNNIRNWVNLLEANNKSNNTIFLIGNKEDLTTEKELSGTYVKDEDVYNLINSIPSLQKYYKVSGKDGTNVIYALEDIILNTIDKQKETIIPMQSSTIKIGNTIKNTNKKGFVTTEEGELCFKKKCF